MGGMSHSGRCETVGEVSHSGWCETVGGVSQTYPRACGGQLELVGLVVEVFAVVVLQLLVHGGPHGLPVTPHALLREDAGAWW